MTTDLKAARERAIEMLRVAAKYARQASDYLPSHIDTVHYDEADCDGLCIADDCTNAADDLLAIPSADPTAGVSEEVREGLLRILARIEPCSYNTTCDGRIVKINMTVDAALEHADFLRNLTCASQEAVPAGWTRETLGRAIYMGLYGHQGAVWAANDSKEVWYACADRVLAAAPPPPVPAASPDGDAMARMLADQRGVFWAQLTGPAKAQLRRDADAVIALLASSPAQGSERQ